MVRPTDQKMTAIEKTVHYTIRFQSRGHAMTWRKTGVGQEAEGEEKTMSKSLYVVSMERNGQGRVSRLRIG